MSAAQRGREAPAIEIRDLTFAYPGASGPVLESVDLVVGQREYVGLVGPNGGGKSTLLRLVLGLLEPQSGSIAVFGSPPRRARPRVGYVPQHAAIDTTVPAVALDVVLTARLRSSPWGVAYRAADREAACAALERTGTAELARRPVASLSGGQRQRVLIARALAAEVDLLLLDEPTTGIDARREEEFFDLLDDLHRRMAIILVTHDLSQAVARAESVVSVNRRVERLGSGPLTPAVMAELYGGAFEKLGHRHPHPERGVAADDPAEGRR